MNNSGMFGALPASLRDELIEEYSKIARGYQESKWESAEMSGGKLCEIVFTIISGHVNGNYSAKASKPSNMVDACKLLEQAGSQFPRAIRIQIPRVLVAVYEVRNNRSVGHTGGEVNPSHMDAVFIFGCARWLMGELIRILHSVDPDEAQKAVDILAERVIPIVWDVDGKKRVLNIAANKEHQTLILLHQVNEAVDSDLASWVEYSNLSAYKKNILDVGHKYRMWEYNRRSGKVSISAVGVEKAERLIAQYML